MPPTSKQVAAIEERTREGSLEHAHRSMDVLHRQMCEYRSLCETLQKDVDRYRATIESWKKDNDKLVADRTMLKAEVKVSNDYASGLEEEVKDLRAKKNTMEEEKKELEQKAANAKKEIEEDLTPAVQMLLRLARRGAAVAQMAEHLRNLDGLLSTEDAMEWVFAKQEYREFAQKHRDWIHGMDPNSNV